MRRILIIGNPGSGKSTLAGKLGERLGLKVIHLDRHFWTPGWVHVPLRQWVDMVGELVQGDSWIVDGNYARTLDIRLERADSVIWLDFPRIICLYRCLLRVLKSFGRVRPDMAEGCREKFDWEFIKYIWTFNERERPIVEMTLNLYSGKIPVLHLKSPREVKIKKILEFAQIFSSRRKSGSKYINDI